MMKKLILVGILACSCLLPAFALQGAEAKAKGAACAACKSGGECKDCKDGKACACKVSPEAKAHAHEMCAQGKCEDCKSGKTDCDHCKGCMKMAQMAQMCMDSKCPSCASGKTDCTTCKGCKAMGKTKVAAHKCGKNCTDCKKGTKTKKSGKSAKPKKKAH